MLKSGKNNDALTGNLQYKMDQVNQSAKDRLNTILFKGETTKNKLGVVWKDTKFMKKTMKQIEQNNAEGKERRSLFATNPAKPKWAFKHERGFTSMIGPKTVGKAFDGKSGASLINR